jgi:hypothetical protein
VHRRRRYERTTPIGRAQKNLAKVEKILALVKNRLESWGGGAPNEVGTNGDLDAALGATNDAGDMVSVVVGALAKLEKSGFVPVKRSSVIAFKSNDEVRIVDKYRDKYLEVYAASTLDGLVVSKTLPTGEIAVKHGKVAFIVPKSHLGRRV